MGGGAIKLESDLKSDVGLFDCLCQAVKQTLQQENSALRGGHDPVREKAMYASQQLAVAAKSAEQNLKWVGNNSSCQNLIVDQGWILVSISATPNKYFSALCRTTAEGFIL